MRTRQHSHEKGRPADGEAAQDDAEHFDAAPLFGRRDGARLLLQTLAVIPLLAETEPAIWRAFGCGAGRGRPKARPKEGYGAYRCLCRFTFS